MRARGWKASVIGAGDLGFGCARRTKLAGGVHGQRQRALAEAAEAGADRWGQGIGERGGRGACERLSGPARSRPGWSGTRACGLGQAGLVRLLGRGEREKRGWAGLSLVLGLG